jgi:hypothetical protein
VSAPPEPPRTLCPVCLLRGDKVWMKVGHMCVTEDPCPCGTWRLRIVLRWDKGQGWLSCVDPCPVCVAEAKRAFQVEDKKGKA